MKYKEGFIQLLVYVHPKREEGEERIEEQQAIFKHHSMDRILHLLLNNEQLINLLILRQIKEQRKSVKLQFVNVIIQNMYYEQFLPDNSNNKVVMVIRLLRQLNLPVNKLLLDIEDLAHG